MKEVVFLQNFKNVALFLNFEINNNGKDHFLEKKTNLGKNDAK